MMKKYNLVLNKMFCQISAKPRYWVTVLVLLMAKLHFKHEIYRLIMKRDSNVNIIRTVVIILKMNYGALFSILGSF